MNGGMLRVGDQRAVDRGRRSAPQPRPTSTGTITGRSCQPSGSIIFGFGWPLTIDDLGEAHRDHRRRADDRAGAQVDAARDDHLGHADGDDPDDRHLQDDDRQPRGVEDRGGVLAGVEQEASSPSAASRAPRRRRRSARARRRRSARAAGAASSRRRSGRRCHAKSAPCPVSPCDASMSRRRGCGNGGPALRAGPRSDQAPALSSWPGSRRCSPASPAGTGCRPSARPPRPWRASARRRARPGPGRRRPGTR